MNRVTEDICQQVKTIMAERGVTQQALANDMNMERVNLTRMLSGRSGKLPDKWEELFDRLGLELVVREKGG